MDFRTNASFSTLSGRAFRVYSVAGRQPSWVIRAAFGAGLLVLLAILAIILVPVIVAMVFVFAIAAGVARVRRMFSPLRSGVLIIKERNRDEAEGRRNVRVIRSS